MLSMLIVFLAFTSAASHTPLGRAKAIEKEEKHKKELHISLSRYKKTLIILVFRRKYCSHHNFHPLHHISYSTKALLIALLNKWIITSNSK